MVKFVIARHGYSVANNEKRFSGQMDVELTNDGVIQAEETAKYVVENYKIDKIYSSDLKRAKKTAELVASATNLPIIYDKDIREIDVGKWQGLTFDEVREKYPNTFELYKNDVGFGHPNGGESYAEFTERAVRVIKKLALENDGKTVFVSTHGGFIRVLRCALNNLPLSEMKNIAHVANSSITILEYDNGNWEFTLIGYAEHLSIKASEFKVQ
jgi:probable phosphoglycerate mutase